MTKRGQTSGHPLWQEFEIQVKDLVSTLDPSASVAHNRRIRGLISQSLRQVDVLAKGKVAGCEMTIVVECKRHGRMVDIGTVDQFIGKILDVGADRGVIYSYSGFTNAATTRAIYARNPAILAVTLQPPLYQACTAPQKLEEVDPREIEAALAGDLGPEEYLYFLTQQKWPMFSA